MKLRKTPSNNRNIYVYKFSDGTSVTLEAGKGGITEIDIQALHRFDDREVYNNVKNLHPARTKEEKQKISIWKNHYIAEFERLHRYSPTDDVVRNAVMDEFPLNYSLSLNAFDDECEEGKNPIQSMIYGIAEKDESNNLEVERLHEVTRFLSPYQQKIYQMIVNEEMSQVDVADKLGVSKQAINKTWKNIQNKIRKLF